VCEVHVMVPVSSHQPSLLINESSKICAIVISLQNNTDPVQTDKQEVLMHLKKQHKLLWFLEAWSPNNNIPMIAILFY